MGKPSAEEEEEEEVMIKKGPWTAEEDEVLINFVKKNGPRDWSSIRSTGLLPRTGKSCRLRWVNKLRPNLKKGCKFSAEEERLVLDLQGRFGNKWATIASYLHGRTDNDVKNFWSTRQKRLARILKSSVQANRSKKNKGKDLLGDDGAPLLLDTETSCSQTNQEPPLQHQPCSNCFYFEVVETTPTMVTPQPCHHPNLYTTAPQFDTTTQIGGSSTSESPFQCSFTELSQPEEITPLLQENCDINQQNFMMDVFSPQEVFEIGNVPQLSHDLPFDPLKNEGVNKDELDLPIKSFNEFPSDFLDYFGSNS